MRINIRKYGYKSLLLLLGGIFLALSIPTYAEEKTVDEEMQQAYEDLKDNDFASLTKNLSEEGNIYDVAYKMARKNSLKNHLDTFSGVAQNINSQYGCSIEAKDVANIASTDPQLSAKFAGATEKKAFSISGEAVVKSCTAIALCVQPDENNKSSTEETYTQERYALCRNTIYNAFDNSFDISAKLNTLDAVNNKDDIFFNGTLDDSPFDLLLDIQKIGDILFKSNEKAPETSFYDSGDNQNGEGGAEGDMG